MQATPVYKDLVLIGGGHSHVAVLKAFGMRPVPGVRLTLISRTTATPYSGMLPGLVAGHYDIDEAHIDLEPLCRFAGARFFRDSATGLDLANARVLLRNRPPVEFDLLSLNTGSTPALPPHASTDASATPVKPVDGFLTVWSHIRREVEERSHSDPLRIGVIGGGAGGVELALAMAARLADKPGHATIELLTSDGEILQTHNPGVRRRLRDALERRAVKVRTNARVTSGEGGRLRLADGQSLDVDRAIWVTSATAPAWLEGSGLQLDQRGFLLVNDSLQSVSDSRIFGAGDVVSMRRHDRPKSGVFAVRQGKPLADNLRNALLGHPLRRYRPQRAFLSLIGTSDGSAVASRGRWSVGGTAVWRWKEWIDRRFMRRFQVLPEMESGPAPMKRAIPAAVGGADALANAHGAMRCGGCGAKVGADILDAALGRLPRHPRPDVVSGLESPDDAALLRIPAGRLLAVSVDAFRPMLDDPFLFGRIAANHCLNDLYAMGADPQSALAIVALPVWPQEKLVEELWQMLSGAVSLLSSANVALIGGHTSEAAEISLGFSVTGLVADTGVLTKRGLVTGDQLVLCKPIGTGVILAAHMRGRARGRWMDAAIDTMSQSNARAADVFREHGAHTCTDVTGFGLLGHLLEMARPDSARIRLALDNLPLIEGASDCLRLGIASTMQPKNERILRRVSCASALRDHALFPLLCDPQTAGGLLAALPADKASNCVSALQAAGFSRSAIIGTVVEANARPPGLIDLAD